jgi:uncharacterized membrane protein YdjX (TVP38/TMEM64 family)
MRYRPSLYTFFLGTALQILSASAFNAPLTIQTSVSIRLTVKRGIFSRAVPKIKAGNQDELMKEEPVRLQVWKSRRNQIRQTLKSADQVRIFRLQQGWVPELGDDGKPLKSDGKVALTLTAFVIAAGAIALRIGGRAALVSTLGLDFVTENPELKANLDIVLNTADSMDPVTKLLLFTASWTAVKVLCFDAAGVALALSSGILFGGVLQGAVVSAAAATFGSTVAFGLAKLDTPLRKKGLGLLDEYPSLRGIEKVVAKEGFKAILTLRLAPLLPIPIGAYNYIYSITNVPLLDFCGGIFIGSLKPYLLDSYLGYFGKSLVDGTADQNGWQDTLLLAALGFSVLIGVFASQLASETWDSVLEEVEAEKMKKNGTDVLKEDEDEDIKREMFGVKLPESMISFQVNMKKADMTMNAILVEEYEAKLWNCTKSDDLAAPDPSFYASSPEVIDRNKGLDLGSDIWNSIVLTPILFGAFAKYADPLYNEQDDTDLIERAKQREINSPALPQRDAVEKALLKRVDKLKSRAEKRIQVLDEKLQQLDQ